MSQTSTPAATLKSSDIALINKNIEDLVNAEREEIMHRNKMSLDNMSVRGYLDQTIMASLYNGLRQLARERPENPFEFLAFHLLKHDPSHKHRVEDVSRILASVQNPAS